MNSGGTERDSGLDADDLLSRARTEHAAQQRRHRRWHEDAGREALTVEAAVLGAVGATVTIGLADGSGLTGTVAAVGLDVVHLASPSSTWWVATEHVDWVATDRALPGSPDELDDVTLAELCADLVGLDEEVDVAVASGAAFAGQVIATGSSLVITSTDGRALVLRWSAVAAVGRRLRVE